jgi:hypothetical protein
MELYIYLKEIIRIRLELYGCVVDVAMLHPSVRSSRGSTRPEAWRSGALITSYFDVLYLLVVIQPRSSAFTVYSIKANAVKLEIR